MNRLIDHLKKKLNLSSDAALARHLELGPPIISKLRHRTAPLTPSTILVIYDKCGVSIELIRALAVEE